MRSIFAIAILAVIPCSAFAQRDLKCDVKDRDYFECNERRWKSYLGKYLCVLDHVAGIQYEDELAKTQPFVGPIKPTEDKFFMEITEDSSLSCDSLFSINTALKCRTKYKISFKTKNQFPWPGYSVLLPVTFISGAGQTHISASGRFSGYHGSGFNHYVFEGRCREAELTR